MSTPLTGASNATGHAYQPGPVADDADRITVFVINAVQTSGGPGPGPADVCTALITNTVTASPSPAPGPGW